MRAQKFRKIAGANFLFAFDQERDVTRKFNVVFEVSLDRDEMSQMLALVVRSAATEELAIAQRRLKRRRLPKIERLRRLHVVMPINDVMRPAFAPRRLGDDHRISW